jgi:DNA-binding NtrC family response regulator
VIERAVILETDEILRTVNLPQEIYRFPTLKGLHVNETIEEVAPALLPEEGKSLYEVEKQTIIKALEKENYNQTRAAKLLGITRDTLRYKIKKYRL